MTMGELVYMFSPGQDANKIQKGLQSPADAVIVDLEDAVRVDEKGRARAIVKEALAAGRNRDKKVYLRINAVSTPWFADDAALVKELPVDGVMLPKCEEPSAVKTLASLVELEIIPLIESAKGVLNAAGILGASPQVRRCAFGSVDFALDIGTEWTPEGTERLAAMGHLVLASRCAGKEPPIDAVFPVIRDEEAFKKDTLLGKKMGFYGKMVIHPTHVEWVRDVYRPSDEEISKCKKIVEAYEQSEARGAFAMDGKLVDLPVYEQAKRIVTLWG